MIFYNFIKSSYRLYKIRVCITLDNLTVTQYHAIFSRELTKKYSNRKKSKLKRLNFNNI